MNKLVYSLFISVFFFDYLFSIKLAPRIISWVPELISILTTAVLCLYIVCNRRLAISTKYLYLIFLYLAIIAIGIIINNPSLTTVFVGLRVHLKHLPFFLLPAVYGFSNKQLREQLIFLLPILILQCPLTLFQRLVQFRHLQHRGSGDYITGTVVDSGMLSLILLCSLSILFAFYLKKKISLRFFIITALCLFLPTAINETKVTLFLLPIALAAPAFFFQEKRSTRVKALFTTCLVGSFLLSVFIPFYDFYYGSSGKGIFSFLQSKKELNEYFFPGKYEIGNFDIRRGDAILMAFSNLSKDAAQFAFGVGIGNVKQSFVKSLSGEHADRARRHGAQATVFTNLFWEIGMAGFIVFALFYYFFFKDALFLMKFDDIFGPLALGWTAVVLVLGASLFYNSYIHLNAVHLPFWYFSGVVASRAFRMRGLARSHSMRVLRYSPPSVPDTVGTRA